MKLFLLRNDGQVLADECFSGPLVRAMPAARFDVSRSADTDPGAPDEHVLALAFSHARILLTEDNDFGDLVFRLGLPTHGVVRVALKSLGKPDQATRLIKAVTELGETVRGALVTIEPTRTSVRRI